MPAKCLHLGVNGAIARTDHLIGHGVCKLTEFVRREQMCFIQLDGMPSACLQSSMLFGLERTLESPQSKM